MTISVLLFVLFTTAAFGPSDRGRTNLVRYVNGKDAEMWRSRYVRMRHYARHEEIRIAQLRRHIRAPERKLRGRRTSNSPRPGAPANLSGPVIATWYGPGFYGNGTACGLTLTQSSWWVAHRTLACGTIVTLCEKLCVRAPVGDRGPYSAATFDLSPAVAKALGGYYTHTVRYRVG